jgi:undecaprenyl pyrophosphate phosphatase UppP
VRRLENARWAIIAFGAALAVLITFARDLNEWISPNSNSNRATTTISTTNTEKIESSRN